MKTLQTTVIKNYYTAPFPANLTEVQLDEPHVVAAWCRHFGVFSPTLKKAVSLVGTEPAALRAYLHKPRDLKSHAGGRYA